MTQTPEIITHRVSKIHKCIGGVGVVGDVGVRWVI